MKKIICSLFVAFVSIIAFAQEKSVNLLNSKWNVFERSKTTFIDSRTNEIFCKNNDFEDVSGAWQVIALRDRKISKLIFSAESKVLQETKGGPRSQYCIFVDIVYSDNSRKFGVTAPFQIETGKWKKAEITFIPEKNIKQVNYHLLFSRIQGECVFRNAEVKEIKE